jgi:hypothetical protein
MMLGTDVQVKLPVPSPNTTNYKILNTKKNHKKMHHNDNQKSGKLISDVIIALSPANADLLVRNSFLSMHK